MFFSSEQTYQVLRGFKGCDGSSGWGQTSVEGQGYCHELIHTLTGRTNYIKNALSLYSKFL